MNIMLVSLVALENLDSQNIYADLLKTFISHGHNVAAITPRERRTGLPTAVEVSHGITLLHVSIGNVTKNGPIEKGWSLLRLQRDFMKAIDANLDGFEPDLIIYATPPTTIAGLIASLKKRYNAKTYLLLKDIFPQNSVDLGMMRAKGPMSLLYRYFKRTERDTYKAADYIGCMSEANRNYLLEHEPWIDCARVEVNPNSIIPSNRLMLSATEKAQLRTKYGVPANSKLIVYGGNLGKPQAIDVLIDALKLNEEKYVCHFLVCGDGTEREKLKGYFESYSPRHATLLSSLPVHEFNSMLCMADAGLILLDCRFTIPNFPSRVLSYMQAALPVVVVADNSTDMGVIAESEGFGVYGSSECGESLLSTCERLFDSDLLLMGTRGRKFLERNYCSEISYTTIVRHFSE